MVRFAMPFPVVPGKTEADVRRVADRLMSDPEAYRESRRRGGVTMERAYLQETPMGNFLVGYFETSRSLQEALTAPVHSDLDIDRFFVAAVKEVHGVDLTQLPPNPPVETVGEWFDPTVSERRRGYAFCAPLAPGKTEEGRAFAREAFVTRLQELTASRRALGECGEVVSLTATPQGDVISVYLEGADPKDANVRFAASTSPFDVWFKEQCARIFPPFVDFSQPVQGITEIFDSEALLARA
ncbi:MAG: hypothetical protein E6I33_08890 [Chloroflexi bacterium]|nr:MAG: hypothetical protein E6I33_08890 [Chloroflexota bacterium]